MPNNKLTQTLLALLALFIIVAPPATLAAELQANDLANNLRMQSQRILIFYSQLEQGVEYLDAQNELMIAIDEYDTTLDTLKESSSSDEALQQLTELDEVWQQFRHLSLAPVTPQNSQALFGQGEQLQEAAFELFEIYETEAGEQHGAVMDVVGKLKFLAYRISMLYTYKVRGFNTDNSLLAKTFKDLDESVDWLRKREENTDYINSQLEDIKRALALLQRSITASDTDLSFTVGMTTKRIVTTLEKLTDFYMEKHEASVSSGK